MEIRLLTNTNEFKVEKDYIYDKSLKVKINKETFEVLEAGFNEYINDTYNYLIKCYKEKKYDVVQVLLQKAWYDLEVSKSYLALYEEEGCPIITEDELMFKVVYDVYMAKAIYHAANSYKDLISYWMEEEEKIAINVYGQEYIDAKKNFNKKKYKKGMI